MKCVACGTDNKLKDRRVSGRCKQCGRQFTFEPTAMRDHPKFTDRFFKKAIADISINHTLFFTLKQFHYFFDRRLKNRIGVSPLGCLILYFFIAFSLVAILGDFTEGLFAMCVIWFVYHFMTSRSLLNSSKSPSSGVRNQRLYALSLQLIGGAVAIFGIYLLFISGQGIFWLVAVVGLATLIVGIVQRRRTARQPQTFLVSSEQVYSWLRSWENNNISIDKLLPAPPQIPPAQTPAFQSRVDPEITAYSFDRVVICQSDRIAQMLIANNFHIEHSCAILSVSGYPQSIFNTTLQMLRRNPALQVFAFHDCNPEGVSLAHHLRNDPQWFPDESVTIVDIGLSPNQVLAASSGVFIQNANPETAADGLQTAVRQSLSSEALQWLADGNFVELESFTPSKLIRVLQRGIAKSQQMNLDEGDRMMLSDHGSDMSALYIVDSFG